MLMTPNSIDPIGNNTYGHIVDNDTDLEIGDIKQPDFRPRIKVKKWSNECNFSIGIQDYGGVVSQVSADMLQWAKGDIRVRFYKNDSPFAHIKSGNYFNPNKAFELDLIYDRKPPSAIIELSVKHKNVGFGFQPAMSLSDCWDKKTNTIRMIQPANIRNSYAVYHKTKMHGKYQTGKICHIPAPVITDSAGRRTLGTLNIPERKDVLQIIIPKGFYDRASYPIIVDPTFGWTSAGAQQSTHSDSINAGEFAISENGIGNSINAWTVFNGGGTIYGKCNVYDGSGSTTYLPNADTEQKLHHGSGVPALETFNFNNVPSFTANNVYLLAIWAQFAAKGSVLLCFDANISGSIGHTEAETYGAWPDLGPDWQDTYNLRRYSIYCDYTPLAEPKYTFDTGRRDRVFETDRATEFARNSVHRDGVFETDRTAEFARNSVRRTFKV